MRWFAITLICASWFGAVASAQPRTATPAPAAPTNPEYATKVQSAIRLLVARDPDGAIAQLREAIAMDSSTPDAVYLLASAQRQKELFPDAVETFRSCARAASAPSQVRWKARCLQGVAETLERMPDQLTNSRAAWQEFAGFVEGAGAAGFAATARSRMEILDIIISAQPQWNQVAQRIRDREAQANRTRR